MVGNEEGPTRRRRARDGTRVRGGSVGGIVRDAFLKKKKKRLKKRSPPTPGRAGGGNVKCGEGRRGRRRRFYSPPVSLSLSYSLYLILSISLLPRLVVVSLPPPPPTTASTPLQDSPFSPSSPSPQDGGGEARTCCLAEGEGRGEENFLGFFDRLMSGGQPRRRRR